MKPHDDEMLSIFIGYDPKEAIAYHACVQSIIENTTIPVSITPLKLSMFKCTIYNLDPKIVAKSYAINMFIVCKDQTY